MWRRVVTGVGSVTVTPEDAVLSQNTPDLDIILVRDPNETDRTWLEQIAEAAEYQLELSTCNTVLVSGSTTSCSLFVWILRHVESGSSPRLCWSCLSRDGGDVASLIVYVVVPCGGQVARLLRQCAHWIPHFERVHVTGADVGVSGDTDRTNGYC